MDALYYGRRSSSIDLTVARWKVWLWKIDDTWSDPNDTDC